MIGSSEEEMSLRAYLLGRMAEDEQRRIEERLLLDSDYVEFLQIIEEDLIDSYLSNSLPEGELEAFQNYFLSTPARQHQLKMARVLRKYIDDHQVSFNPATVEKPTLKVSWWRSPVWRVAAAAMLVLGIGSSVWLNLKQESLAEKGRETLAQALKQSPIEGRVSSFDWSPQQLTLGDQQDSVVDKVLFERAKTYLLDAVIKNPGPDSSYALGQFYMANGELDNAIEKFDEAIKGDPNNAKLRNDLGAALLERARNPRQKGSPGSLQDFDESLKNLNQALALDNSLLPALFNRALCYEYMQVMVQAEADWREYLNRDNNSLWAEEAKRHLKDIEEKKQRASQVNEGALQQFLTAFRTSDRQTAWKLISDARGLIKGQLIWWRLLDDFFNLTRSGKLDEANERVRALQYAGELALNPVNDQTQQNRDHYLAELGKFYGSLSSQRRESVAEAHRLINEGSQLYINGKYDQALSAYTQAKEAFTRTGNQEEAMLADFFIGNCHIQKGEPEQSKPLFENIAERCREKNYLWLLGQSSFSLAMAQDREAEYSKALESTRHALQISEGMSDTYNTQRSLSQIADQYRKLGNYELSSSSMNLCLEQVKAAWPEDRQMWRNYDQLIQVLTARRLNTAAAAYANEALRLALSMKDSSMISVSYIHLAMVHSRQQDYAEAIRLCKLGFEAAHDSHDSIGKAYSSLQLGHLHRQAGDLGEALSDYDQSIKYIDAEQTNTGRLPALRYDAHKGRLFCLFAQGDDTLARQELERTLELLEKYRRNIQEEKNRNTFFNVEQTVYDAAIDFENSRAPNNDAVFNYSEESRARSLLDMINSTNNSRVMKVDEIQQHLHNKTQLIEYIVLDNKLLICLLSKSEFSIKEVDIAFNELTDKVLDFRRMILRRTTDPSAQAKELYNLLISPINLSADNGERICIVPDKILNNLPFAALISPDSGRYLIKDYDLTVSPSATVYIACTERTAHRIDKNHERLFAVGDPSFDHSAFPGLSDLPTTSSQIKKIEGFYPSSSVLTGSAARKNAVKSAMEEADVIHLASHYLVYEGDPMNSRLLLAKEPSGQQPSDSSSGFLRADEVYSLKLRRAPLVVLSACESGVEHYYNGEGMIGMSRVFIAAGAPIVVASLWRVDVYATDNLMIDFHKYRKTKNFSTSESLRLAQIDMLSNSSKEHPYYWAGFTPIGGHTDF